MAPPGSNATTRRRWSAISTALLVGVLLLGVGFISGAFVQRKRFGAVFWVASGVALVALNIVTWHCPGTGIFHVLPNHMGAAVGLLVLATAAGLVARRVQA